MPNQWKHNGLRRLVGKTPYLKGLTVPIGWQERDGPVYLPEGPSDVLALTAMNLSAVGRPSNLGGIDHLVKLLRGLPPERCIVVLGEFDQKANGKWPGRDGAVATANSLREKLN